MNATELAMHALVAAGETMRAAMRAAAEKGSDAGIDVLADYFCEDPDDTEMLDAIERWAAYKEPPRA